jgi:hypothetical protein
LSLAATLVFVKTQLKARLTSEDRVWRPIYRALLEGALSAIGDFENRDGKVVARDQQVLAEDWRALRESEFVDACYRPGVLTMPNYDAPGGPVFLTNVRIETSQVRAWLGLDGTTNSAKPTKTFAASDLERDVRGYRTRLRESGQEPTQLGAEDTLSEKYPRDCIRAEIKRQVEGEGGELKAGRPKKASPEN